MFSIRMAVYDDAAELARLLTALGHATDTARIESMWAAWTAAGGAALVATHDGDVQLAGVATTHRISVLHRPAPLGRVTALIVDAPYRRRGLGRQLVEAAEAQLASHGCRLLEITSNLQRTEAHVFYEALGYERTSYRFAKVLGS